MDENNGIVDIDLIYSTKSTQLDGAVEETANQLKGRGYKVRRCGEVSGKPHKDARFRVYFFNKAFKNHQLHHYEDMLFDKCLTTPDNSVVLAHNAHRKHLPSELSTMQLSVPLLDELTAEESMKQIMKFLADREAQGRKEDKLAFEGQFKKLREATDDFNSGRAFILVSNVRRPVDRNCECLGTLPWIKVFDMSDNTSQSNGFLTAVRRRLVPGKFSITSMDETLSQTKPESDYTDWTVWKSDCEEALFSYVNLLQDYCCGLKVPTVIVLWYPTNDDFDLDAFNLVTRITCPFKGGKGACCVLVTDRVPQDRSPLGKMLPAQDRESNRVIVPLPTFLNWFSNEMQTRVFVKNICNLLPVHSLDDERPTAIALTERDLNYLNYGMHVLTFDESDARSQQMPSKSEAGINFLQGDNISWETIADGRFDAMRDLLSKVVEYIEENHVKDGASGITEIHHHPGSGGTTLGRRVLWEMRKRVPCIDVSEGTINVDNLKEKITFLRRLTVLPTILLLDGPVDAENILKVLPSERVIILHVSRFYGSMENRKNLNGHFYLKEALSREDSEKVLPIYKEFGKHSCKKLEGEIRSGRSPFMFEFGLTAFTDNFRGIREYVKSHLQEEKGDKDWKRVIEYLALAKHYGHKVLPRQIFCKMLDKSVNSVVKKKDIGYLGRQLIQGDGDYWSIRYVEIAREVLIQSLVKDGILGQVGTQMLELTGSACDNLKDLTLGFIEVLRDCISKPNDLPSRILEILKSVFIMRYDNEGDKYKKFSMLLTDVDSDKHREEIFKKLVECYPKHADFHAHLGRFFGRVGRFEEAENALLDALKTRREELNCYRHRGVEGDDDILSRIHHMLGTSYFEKMLSCIPVNMEEINLAEIQGHAEKAIKQFEYSRMYFTVASNQAYGILSEVKVRLEVVKLAKERGLFAKLSANANQPIEDFSAKSYGICDRLLAQCAERVDDKDLKNSEFTTLVKRILDIYGDLTPLLEKFCKTSAKLSSNDCKLASLMHKHCSYGHRFSAFSQNLKSGEVSNLVSLLREIIDDSLIKGSKRRVSTEMLEWLKLIRRLSSPPSLEEVLKMVEKWDDCKERHSLSTFYLYVIYVAKALNYSGKKMNEIFRKEVESLKEKLNIYQTTISRHLQVKSQEFLGIAPTTMITCLVNKDQVDGDIHKNPSQYEKFFRRFTGTVVEVRDWSAIFHLEEPGPDPIKVFCAQRRYKLTRQHAKEQVRVSFYIQFNPRHGAEAFDVAELQNCDRCGTEVEVHHYEFSAVEEKNASMRNQCKNCGAKFI